MVRIKCSLCLEAAIHRPKSSQTKAARKNATISKTTNRNLIDISFRQSVNIARNSIFFNQVSSSARFVTQLGQRLYELSRYLEPMRRLAGHVLRSSRTRKHHQIRVFGPIRYPFEVYQRPKCLAFFACSHLYNFWFYLVYRFFSYNGFTFFLYRHKFVYSCCFKIGTNVGKSMLLRNNILIKSIVSLF